MDVMLLSAPFYRGQRTERYIKELHYGREAGSGLSVDPRRDSNNHYALKYSEVVGGVTVGNCTYTLLVHTTDTRYCVRTGCCTVFFQAFIVMDTPEQNPINATSDTKRI
ncbi:hypothetical protein CBL_01259 [Carabus blaptoides fortunei]